MQAHFVAFFRKNLMLSVFLALVVLVLAIYMPALKLSYIHTFIILFFFLFSLLSHFIILWLTEKNAKKFINYFMISTLVKLLVYCGIIIVYIFNFREAAKPFAIVFLLSYVCYTIIEVSSLQKFVKRK